MIFLGDFFFLGRCLRGRISTGRTWRARANAGGRSAAPEFVTIDAHRANLECDAAAKNA